MNPSFHIRRALAAGFIALAFASFTVAVSAQIVVSGETNNDTGFTVSSTDLLQTSLVSTTDNISVNVGENNAIGGSVALLNNGSFGAVGASGGICISGGSVTYYLNTPGASPGYDISQVNVYSGWENDGRDGQNYTLSYSTVANPLTFVNISTVVRDESGRFEKTSVTEATAPNLLATGVKAIRITFNGQENGGVGYKEIDVIGTTPVILPRNLTWNNGAATNAWNTTNTNWSGSIWDNTRPDNAYFTSVGGTVNLDTITAGSVNVGNTGINFATVALTGGTLGASSLAVQGFGNNNGNYGSNPTLTLDTAVTISGDAAVGRANLAVTSGNFTANRIISAPASADWGRLVVSGGTVTATNGVDGSIYTTATFAIDLNGGELRAPSIRVADREAGDINNAWLTFNGGTLKAIGANNADFITTYGGSQNTYVASGGAIIDTNGHNIGIQVNLLDAGGAGGLTKNGTGTLTLSGANTYTGNTTVENGTLGIAQSNFADSSTVTIGTSGASPAVLYLPNAGTDIVTSLIIDGAAQAGNGAVYDSTNSSGAITGSGKIQVGTASADPFLAWIDATWPTLSNKTPTGDPDNDGIANLVEYVLKNGDPSTSSIGILPILNASGTNFVFTFLRRIAATGTIQTFQYGSNLTGWTDVPVTNGGIVSITSPEAGIEQVVITVAKGANTQLFGRLQVVK